MKSTSRWIRIHFVSGVAALLLGAAGALGAAPQASPVVAEARQDAAGRPAQETRGAVSEKLVFEDISRIITASRHAQRASEAPASVEVITSEEMARQGYRTLAEALQSVPGIYVNFDRNYTYIGVRGFARPGDYNSRVQIQLNGHPMNDNIWDYVGTGEDQSVDINLVERIEIVYGPGSALYGSNALFATINIITKSAASLGGAELALEGGSFGRRQARLSYGGKVGGWKLTASGSALDSSGDDVYFREYDALGQNGGLAEGTDFEDSYRFYARAERGPYSIQASSSYRVKGIPTGAFFSVFNDDATRTTDARNLLEVEYRSALADGVDLLLRGSYNEYRYWGTYRYDPGGGVLVDNIDRSTGRWLSQEAQVDWSFSQRHHLTAGQGFVRNFDARVENFDEEPSFVYTDVSDTYSEYSFYVQHEYRPRTSWLATGGLRYDDYSTFGSSLNPRFALVYAPQETWRIKVMGGRAFRAPNFYELFWEGPTGLQAGPGNLDPETLTLYELAFESRLASRADMRLTFYRGRIRDLITQVEVSPGVFQFQNVERAETEGAELSLRARFANGTSGYLSFSWMHAVDGSEQHLSNFPNMSYKAGVSVPLRGDRWVVSGNAQYYEERLTLAGDRSPDAFVVNTTLLAPLFHRDLRLAASVFNLFDRDYGLPASAEHQDLELIPQDGRSFVARVLWRF